VAGGPPGASSGWEPARTPRRGPAQGQHRARQAGRGYPRSAVMPGVDCHHAGVMPRLARRPVHLAWWSRGRRVSLAIVTPMPPLAGSGFAETAGSGPDARCRAAAASVRTLRAPAEGR
jgi:hypothetical protein